MLGHSNLAPRDFLALLPRPHRLTVCARIERGRLTYQLPRSGR
jgi:hypothetical protein